MFSVSPSMAVRLAAAPRDHGSVAPKPQGLAPGTAGKLAAHIDFLLARMKFDPDTTLQELADVLREDRGVEVQLAPLLSPGTVVILDNLGTHKSSRAAEALKEAKSWFLFLPPYSPDLIPIEQAFSKLKAHLRRIGARTYDDLVAAIGDVCALFDPTGCWNFFEAAGYASD